MKSCIHLDVKWSDGLYRPACNKFGAFAADETSTIEPKETTCKWCRNWMQQQPLRELSFALHPLARK